MASWLSKDSAAVVNPNSKWSLDDEEHALEKLRRTDIGSLTCAQLAKEVYLRARKCKRSATPFDDTKQRSKSKVQWKEWAQLARLCDGDSLTGVVDVPAPGADDDTPAPQRTRKDNLNDWQYTAGDEMRLVEMMFIDEDEAYGDVARAWELFLGGFKERPAVDAGHNPVGPGVEGTDCPFQTTLYPMFCDASFQPENLYKHYTPLREISPVMSSETSDLILATTPPYWECLRLRFKDLMSRANTITKAVTAYSGDEADLDGDKSWSFAKGDSGAWYVYLRLKNRDDLYAWLTDLPPGMSFETGEYCSLNRY